MAIDFKLWWAELVCDYTGRSCMQFLVVKDSQMFPYRAGHSSHPHKNLCPFKPSSALASPVCPVTSPRCAEQRRTRNTRLVTVSVSTARERRGCSLFSKASKRVPWSFVDSPLPAGAFTAQGTEPAACEVTLAPLTRQVPQSPGQHKAPHGPCPCAALPQPPEHLETA